MDLERIYAALPGFLQNAAVSVQGYRIKRWRYGGDYGRIFEECRARDRLDTGAIREYQAQRLRAIFEQANKAPFWRQRFADYEVDTGGKDPFFELRKLPVLSKGEVKAAVDRIMNPSVDKRRLITRHTSGTTGSGLVFPDTRSSEQEIWATWWRYRTWHGISPNMWCGYFGGRSVVPVARRKLPFWRVNRPGRQIMFSAYHLNDGTAADYVSALGKYELTWLHGYPSVLSLLASFILDQRLNAPEAVRIITTGAETLTSCQRRKIEAAFNAKVAQHYGQAEGVANISECEHGTLHVDEDFSYVEFEPLEGAGNAVRIIGTNWVNAAFPLLRYDTGDTAMLQPAEACACGRPSRCVLQIDGRIEDYLVLPDGTKIGRLDHIFKDLVNIREAQIHQSSDGTIAFRIVKGSGYSDGDERKLRDEISKRLGRDVGFEIQYWDVIPKTVSGKLRMVVSDYEKQASAPKTHTSVG